MERELKYRVKTSFDLLMIDEIIFYVLPKEKFVRRKDIRKVVSKKTIGEYKIVVPFEIKEIEREEIIDCTHFHSDYTIRKWTEHKKIYKEPDLQNFIKEKLSLHLKGFTCVALLY